MGWLDRQVALQVYGLQSEKNELRKIDDAERYFDLDATAFLNTVVLNDHLVDNYVD